MKVLLVSTTFYESPPKNYGGTELIVWLLAEELNKLGHKVSVVAPQGSRFSAGIEHIPTVVPQIGAMQEDAVWPSVLLPRLVDLKTDKAKGEFDVVHESSFTMWSYMAAKDHPDVRVCATIHWQCLPPSTPILTGRGWLPIEKVRVGDEVLTHKGRFKRVTRTFSRPYDGELVNLQIRHRRPLQLTPEHPILTQRGWLRPFEVVEGDRVEFSLPTGIVNAEYSPQMFYLFGLYCADGHADAFRSTGSRDSTVQRVKFHLGLGETDIVARTQKAITSLGLEPHTRRENNTWRVDFCNVPLATRFAETLGESWVKHIPSSFYFLPSEHRRAFIDGIMDGDGHVESGGRRRSILDMVNLDLVAGTSVLLRQEGRTVAFYRHRFRTPNTRSGVRNDQWRLEMGNSVRSEHDGEVVGKEATPYAGAVHNLEVEDDNSYLTIAGTVHNCHWPFLPAVQSGEASLLPPVPKPNFIGLSNAHALAISTALGVPVEYVHNGIPVEAFPFQKEKGDRFLYLGRIARFKGPHLAIHLADKLGFPLDVCGEDRFVGDPPYVHQVMNACRRMATYRGEVRPERKLELLKNAKAVLLPYAWPEPFGIVPIEANSCGTPAIGLDYPGSAMREIIEDGVNGFLCRTIDEMGEATKNVSDIKPEECRRVVEEKFTAAIMAAKYEKLYERVVSSDGGW